MKLLFDNNLSVKLPSILKEIFPDSVHVLELGKEREPDINIWNFAKENNYTIVSKDWDFYYLNTTYGAPPKLIWITRGNCKFEDIVSIFNENKETTVNFLNDKTDLLVLK